MLKELQATIEEDIEEIETNILRFVATVYDYLSSQSPENPSLVYSAYENLENMKRGLAEYVSILIVIILLSLIFFLEYKVFSKRSNLVAPPPFRLLA